ncbi:MAG: hypothetical protein PGN08_03415 [Sphingomonas taxi]
MVLIASLLLIQAAAQPPVDQDLSAADSTIIVRGSSLADSQAALDRCKAQHCSPDREIYAAITVASKQFVDGDYAGARHTLLASRSRNARYDARYPKPVSDLHRALVQMSRLDGRPFSARVSTFDATDALRAPTAPDDQAVMFQRLETGHQLAAESNIPDAIRLYDDVAADARQRGFDRVEAQAMFDAAALYASAASVDFQYRGAARRRAMLIEKRQEPAFQAVKDGLVLLKAKLAVLTMPMDKRSAYLAAATLPKVDDAILLSEPFPKYVETTAGLSGSTSDFPEWGDVAFWVRPDGSVSAPRLIGQSAQVPGPWLGVKIKSVSERRYAPLRRPAGDPGLYVVERYSMVHNIQSKTGSALMQRDVNGMLVTTDITLAHKGPVGMM